MKKIVVYSCIATFALLSACSEQEQKTTTETTSTEVSVKKEKQVPAIKFDETEFDFGTIQQGESIEHVFHFTNTGNAPLIIYKAKAGCGCTIPSFEKDHPILPGERGRIDVKFNSAGKSGTQIKNVEISTNVSDTEEVVIIKGEVNVPEK